MAQLSQIKQRIRAVQKTQKITRAMRLIAMSLYSKLERQRALLSSYEKSVAQISSLLHDHLGTVPEVFVPKQDDNTRPLIILCSSSKGLCGGMNSSIMRYFEKTFMLQDQQQARFIGIGAKACAFLQERRPNALILSSTDSTLLAIPELTNKIIAHICEQKEAPYSSVSVYYTHLKNFFLQTPLKQTLIPLDLTEESTQSEDGTPPAAHYIWEQPVSDLSGTIAKQYLYARLVHMLFDNLISENAARFIAMDQSTNNAEKYLETLSIDYNKSRQSLITREIAQLSSNLEGRS